MRHGVCRFILALALSAHLLLLSPVSARTSGQRFFNIPAQPLSSAVVVFSRQSGISVIAPAPIVRGKPAPRVRGPMPPERALAALLAGTGLQAVRRGGIYVIQPRPPEPSATRPAAPPILPAPAAPAPPAAGSRGSGVAEIVVTASRIAGEDDRQASPIITVGLDVIERDAKPSIGDIIRELPAVGRSASPNNGVGAGGIVAGNAGMDTVNLRHLGPLRTLVLFDGKRVIESNINGQVDIGTLPTVLVDRVDVVTAGASAAWGSDAVAGVVNLVLNKSFTGMQARFDSGNSHAADHRSRHAELALGTDFGQGRGQLILSASHLDSPDVVFAGQRAWNTYPALMNNRNEAAGGSGPRYVWMSNTGLSQATTGGLIAAGPLAGIQFSGPDATPVPFDFGQVSGPISAGGDAEQRSASLDNLTVAYRSTTLFGYSSYELADQLKIALQLSQGESRSRNSSVPVMRFGNLPIRSDNAFLPQPVKDRMAQLGLETIPVGTTNLNNLPEGPLTLADLSETVGVPTATTRRRVRRALLSLYGGIGEEWSWEAFYLRSEARLRQDVTSNLIPANFNRAIDAIVAPAGNTAGIVPGTIICRSTLTDPTNGCFPLNIFGTGVASPESIAYVNVAPGQNYQIQRLAEDILSASVQGTLPLALPAGNIALAAGVDHRRERGEVVTDPGAEARLYALGNFAPFRGRYTVTEAFAEADVPLVQGGAVGSLNLDAASRLTRYSTSGLVVTWKLGLSSQLTPQVHLRGTLSRDIRAPILDELFSQGVATSGSAIDPHTGQNVPIFTFRTGNPELRPEVARTYSAGIDFTPEGAPGLSLSADYYRIRIRDAIATLTAPQVLSRCLHGEASLCDQLVFGAPGSQLSQINLLPMNMQTDLVEGLDYQLSYERPALGGLLRLRLIGTYILRQSREQLGDLVEFAGGIGPDNPVEGVPRARANLSLTLEQERLSLTGQVRFIGAARLVNAWTAQDVDRNRVPAIAYLDLRASYRLASEWELYGAIDNLLNQDPPLLPGTADQGQNVYYFTATRGDLYDVVGLSYRFGARLRF